MQSKTTSRADARRQLNRTADYWTTHDELPDDIDNPEVVVLDSWTRRRLQDLAEPGERTIDDVVQRHCDAVETRRELGAFCKEFLDEGGRENVVQITVAEQVSEGAMLSLTVHGNASLEDIDVVDETDAITIADRRFDFHVEVNPYGPSSLNCTTIYGVDPPDIGKPDSSQSEVPLADGVEAIRNAVAARISDEDARTPGTALD